MDRDTGSKSTGNGMGESAAGWQEVMNVEQASRYLAVTPDTLYKYLSEGKIPAFKLGNRWRLKKTTLDEWMERESQARESRPGKKARSAQL